MHPYMIELLAGQHETERRRSARRHGPHVPRRRGHRSVRHRAGWALVAIGLTLARGSPRSGDDLSPARRPPLVVVRIRAGARGDP
jgi:hypothetical protein